MPTLTVQPNPVAPSKRLDCIGSGFSPNSSVKVAISGGAFTATAYPANDGTFRFSIPTPSTVGPAMVTVTVGGKVVASAQVTVAVPVPPLAFHTAITNGMVLAGSVAWIATVDAGTPDHFDFLVDGALHWHELQAPWGGSLDTTALANGDHVLTVTGYPVSGVPVTQQVTVTIANAAPVVAQVICSGYASTKDNVRIGISVNTHGNVALRSRKNGTGALTGLAWQQRIGSGYSAGDGGLYRLSAQMDVGGHPSGVSLGSGTFTFNVNRTADAYFEPWVLPTPTSPVADGALFHWVLENIHADPAHNYVSMNLLYMWGDDVGPQRQPGFPNTDLAALLNTGSGWVESSESPNFDSLPNHEGQAYTQCSVDKWQTVSGLRMVRQRLTVPAFDFGTIIARVRRTSGGSPLTMLVEQGATVLAQGSVPASAIAASSPGGDNGGQVRAIITLSSRVVVPAGPLALRLTAPADTVYTVTPIRRAVRDNVKTQPDWGSFLAPGIGESSTDGGKTWASIYTSVEPQEDVQFALL